MKKPLAYILIVLGALDIILWVINGFTVGWLEYVVGSNIISQFGGWAMLAIGVWILKKEKAKYQSQLDDVDMDQDETIIFKQMGKHATVTITSKRVRFRALNLKELKKYENKKYTLPSNEAEDYYYEKISAVEPVKQMGMFLGINLTLVDGQIIHIPISKAELLAKHIEKQLSK